MKVLEAIISFLQFEAETPKMYGVYHIFCLIAVVALSVLLIKYVKDDRKLLLVMSLIMIGFEIYKQLSFSFDDGEWSYRWYAFPFQFCSVPMYVALIAALTRSNALRQSLYMFLSTYGLVAGIAVMLYPNTVFIREVLIDVQTMVHHGFIVVMGAYLIATKKVCFDTKNILRGVAAFATVLAIAFVGNIVTYKLDIDGGLELFYISPYHTSILPVFNVIYEKVHYVVFLLTYILAFSLGSLIPFGLVTLVRDIRSKHSHI